MASNVSEQLWQDFNAVKQNAFNALVNIFKENNITSIDICAIQRTLKKMAETSNTKLAAYYKLLNENIGDMCVNRSFDVGYGDTFRESMISGVKYEPKQSRESQISFIVESLDGDFKVGNSIGCVFDIHYYLLALSILEYVLSVIDIKDGVITPKAPYIYAIYEDAKTISESNLFETKDEAFQFAIDDACNYVKKMERNKDGNCTLYIKKEQGFLHIDNSKDETLRVYSIKQYTPDKD